MGSAQKILIGEVDHFSTRMWTEFQLTNTTSCVDALIITIKTTIAYAGLDAPPYQSGQFEATNRHISKRGNKYLRKTGYEIMKSIKRCCNCDNELKSYIIKKEQEGKAKKVAKIAGLNKFLRIYYGIVKKR